MNLHQLSPGILINLEEIAYMRQIDWPDSTQPSGYDHMLEITLRSGEVKGVNIGLDEFMKVATDSPLLSEHMAGNKASAARIVSGIQGVGQAGAPPR